jgi:hypothetical protein
MSEGIQFDEDKFNYSVKPQPNFAGTNGQQYSSSSNATGLAGWLIKKGWVKSESAAQVVLFGVIGINIIITIVIIKFLL